MLGSSITTGIRITVVTIWIITVGSNVGQDEFSMTGFIVGIVHIILVVVVVISSMSLFNSRSTRWTCPSLGSVEFCSSLIEFIETHGCGSPGGLAAVFLLFVMTTGLAVGGCRR